MTSALAQAVAALERAGIDYFVGGSMASIVHGEMRTTQDADIIVRVPSGALSSLAATLDQDFFVDGEFLADCFAVGSSCNVIHRKTGFKIDFFPLKTREFSKSEMTRASYVTTADGSRMRIASAEDCVLAKLEWFEKGDRASDRQWRDVLGVMKAVGPALDFAYMRRWADSLGLAELLGRAITEAGL